MSDKKTIDVAEGDTFGADAYLCQMRGDEFRNFEERGVTGWTKTTRYAGNPALRPVSRKDAELMIRMAGYTLTPAKPEQAEQPALAATVRRLEERIRTLETELAQAKADREVLAEEVNEWRRVTWASHAFHKGALDVTKLFNGKIASNGFDRAVRRTNESGALSRAGGK
jgi:hypothetical protein